jgi:alpha-L-fucosidase
MEACQTMNHHWGAAENDLDYKAPRTFIEMLNTCRKQNANYLLNIGLRGDGSVPIMSQAILHEIGIWTHMASSSFYDGTLSTLHGENGVYALDTSNYTDLYCPGIPLLGVKNVVEENDDFQSNMELNGATKKVKSIHWVDSGEELQYIQDGEKIHLRATGFPYGRDFIVRIARIEWE